MHGGSCSFGRNIINHSKHVLNVNSESANHWGIKREPIPLLNKHDIANPFYHDWNTAPFSVALYLSFDHLKREGEMLGEKLVKKKNLLAQKPFYG